MLHRYDLKEKDGFIKLKKDWNCQEQKCQSSNGDIISIIEYPNGAIVSQLFEGIKIKTIISNVELEIKEKDINNTIYIELK